MANTKGVRTDKFTSKPGDFTVVKPGKTSGGGKSTKTKK